MGTTLRSRDSRVSAKINYSIIATLITIVLVGIFLDIQNQKVAGQQMRAQVRKQIGLIRTKLEGNINNNIYLVRGLISTIQTEPDMNQDRFAELARHLFKEQSQLRNIAAAPDLVISLMYPMAGNEKAIGLDYRKNDKQRAAALQVRDHGHFVLAGPVNLIQGGQGFIGRFPVFSVIDGKKLFWGIVSAVIDVKRLYQDSGILDDNLPIDIAIIGKDASGALGDQFFGHGEIIQARPVFADVVIQNGSWRVAAIPKGGWTVPFRETWANRSIIIIAGILIFLPIFITGRFVNQRRKNFNELRLREEQLERLSKRLELALDISRVGVWEMNLGTGKLVWDERMAELYGLPFDGEKHNYENWEKALHPHDLKRARQDFQTAIERKIRYHSEFRVIRNAGDVRNVRAIGAVYDEANGSSRIIGVNWDVTADVALNDDLKRAKSEMEIKNTQLMYAKSRIEHLALHDSLTGIPNRRFLDDTLSELAAKSKLDKSKTALLIVDLDRFKQINDTFGHATGDALLIHVSSILKSCVRAADFVARIGGDEFVIVCDTYSCLADLEILANSIITKMKPPMSHNGKECRFGVSIGISSDGSSSMDPKQLLINADLALYRAKRRGRSCFEFFSEDLRIESSRNKKVADEIHRGIEQSEFIPYYQPQFDAKTGLIVGAEALVRWNHPRDGILDPCRFMNIAEEISVSSEIDHSILEQTLNDFDRWHRSGFQVPKVSVNVSLQRLSSEKLLDNLSQLNFRPGTLSFELVESIFLDKADDIILNNINRIKEMGIEIEIDDFGTGHTSMVSLINLEPARLKIDRQLIIPAINSPVPLRLVELIIEIGKSLNIDVIAEGVETLDHARLLRNLGCSALQGFAFARPMSACEFEDYLDNEIKLTG